MNSLQKKLFFGFCLSFLVSFFVINLSIAATATFIGQIDDDGGDPYLYVWFQYGKTTFYGFETPHQEKYGTGEFTATVTNLEDCTTYHYRAVARHRDFDDTKYGEDKTFTTPCAGAYVDIKANGSDGPITVAYNSSVNLIWTSSNVSSCQASGDWSGAKSVSGSESTSALTSSKTYTITCSGPQGSVSDSVSVNVSSAVINVNLSASPSSGCVPLNNVSLTAYVSGTISGDITYYFDCTSDGIWDRVYTSSNTSYTASNICNFSSVGTFSAKVKVTSGNVSAENTTSINVSSCVAGNLIIEKTVRNLSDGQLAFSKSVLADPSEVLEFQIKITAISQVQNLTVKDVLPDRISLRSNTFKIDGILSSGNIQNGISLGTFSANQTKTITFLADISGPSGFNFGDTNLTNTATANWDGNSLSDTASVTVRKTRVLGATTAPTGWIKEIFLDPLFILSFCSLALIYLFKSHFIKWEEWFDERKIDFQKFRAENLLKLKTAKIKFKNFVKRK